jgi:hypothetical protein
MSSSDRGSDLLFFVWISNCLKHVSAEECLSQVLLLAEAVMSLVQYGCKLCGIKVSEAMLGLVVYLLLLFVVEQRLSRHESPEWC